MRTRAKKMIKSTTIIMVVIIVCSMLGGCVFENVGAKKQNDCDSGNNSHTVYLIDQTIYSPVYDYKKLLKNTVSENYAVNYSTASVIRIEGNPDVVYNDTFTPSDKMITKSKEEKNRMHAVNQVIKAITDNTLPVDEEVNVLAAIRLACQQLNSYDDDGNKRMVLVSSGLSTKAPLDMTAGLDNIDINGIVKNLISNKEIPQMNDIYVDIYGVGYITTGRGQDELSALASENLRQLYEDLFIACGVDPDNIRIHSNVPDGDESRIDISNLPNVTPVPTNGISNSFVNLSVQNKDQM